MTGLFIALIIIILLIGAGVVILNQAGVTLKPKKPEVDAELDENVPVEDLHSIIKRQYVRHPYSSGEVVVVPQVECVCGWQTTGTRKDYVKDQGDNHVRTQHSRINKKREEARRVAEKLAENEKGDFAW